MTMEGRSESVSSVSYEVGAKGDVKPSVKAYNLDIAVAEQLAAETLKVALKRIASGEFQVAVKP